MEEDVGYSFILSFTNSANGFWDNTKVVQVGLVGSHSQPKENFDFVWNFLLPNPAMMKRVGKGLFHNMEDGFGGEQTIWVALPVVLVVVQRIKA